MPTPEPPNPRPRGPTSALHRPTASPCATYCTRGHSLSPKSPIHLQTHLSDFASTRCAQRCNYRPYPRPCRHPNRAGTMAPAPGPARSIKKPPPHIKSGAQNPRGAVDRRHVAAQQQSTPQLGAALVSSPPTTPPPPPRTSTAAVRSATVHGIHGDLHRSRGAVG